MDPAKIIEKSMDLGEVREAAKVLLWERDNFKGALEKAIGAPDNVFEKTCCAGAYRRGYALGHKHGEIGYSPPTAGGFKPGGS